MLEYTKNKWTTYDKTLTEEENLRNSSIIVADKLNHMEEGIEKANKTLEVGIVKTIPSNEPPVVTIVEEKERKVISFSIPKGEMDMVAFNNAVEELKKVIEDNSAKTIIGFTDSPPILEKDQIAFMIEGDDSQLELESIKSARISNIVLSNYEPIVTSVDNWGKIEGTAEGGGNGIIKGNSQEGKLTVDDEPLPDTTFFADTDGV